MQVRIPDFYRALINWDDPHDPLRLMVEPSAAEQQIQSYELTDPIGDHAHEPVRGLIHRYPDRCLLLLTTHCGIHCRFCFRRDVVGTLLPIDIKGMAAYLHDHTEIHEVIFSGGDPGTFPPEFFASLMQMLSQCDHIRIVRVHTRILVADPTVFSQAWLTAFLSGPAREHIVVLHINHPREITPELCRVVAQLRSQGVLVLSQSVLLKGVNDTAETLRTLFTQLSEHGIKPYYLHHLDAARGTHHFRISIREGKKLYLTLRGTISGHSLPEYVLDLPGGDGKVPVMWLREVRPDIYEIENFTGKLATYIDPISYANHMAKTA